MKFSSYRFVALLICALIGFTAAFAKPDAEQEGQKQKTLLILNSYNEHALWARQLVAPITLFVAKDQRIHAELFSLNNILVTDSAAYNQVKGTLFDTYKDQKPDYIVAIGNLAFSMRDEIKKQWGDLPILLITRDLAMAPAECFFSGFNQPVISSSVHSIAELHEQFNFTAIYVPDFYEKTIELMTNLIPEMDELVFFSDNIYLNRNLAHDIEMYLYEQYPNVKFKWVQASGDRPDDLQYYFVNRLPHSGLLLSTWYYEKKNSFGYPILVSGDMNLLNSSVNPVFSLREAHMDTGAIGGVYADADSINSQIERVLTAMVSGQSLRDIKFFTNKHNYETLISYPKLIEYGINPDKCPDDTVFVNRPATFWEKYLFQVLSAIVIFALVLVIFIRRNMTQHREIANLMRHRNFVEKMPMPYTKAKVIYDDNNEVVNIKYALYNQAFERILKANCWHVDPYWIFPNEFIAEKTKELIKSHDSISFKYHFEKTDTYYIFTLCFVEGRKVNDKELVDEIDLFATDITDRQKNVDKLTKMTRKLDMTLMVSNLVPWEWRIPDDNLELDTEIIERKRKRLTNDHLPDYETTPVMSVHQFLGYVHPEDREKMRELGKNIRERRVKEFTLEWRLLYTKKGEEVTDWVEINGAVTKYDEDGNPVLVSGSMCLITDRKAQEQALIEARERATESDKLKSTFLANMSHEIRTPLNAIVGFSGLICETDDPVKKREFAGIINQNNDMLLSLVNDVLDLAKIESNTLEIIYSNVNLNHLLNTVNKTIKMRVHKGVALNMVPGLPVCMIRTDSNRLSQVLMNLLTNATKFTTKGSITFGYDVLDNKEIYFYVKDTGIGVSPENQSRLFQRFDKLNNFMQGNGLGLSICKSVVERLGGTIGMKSRGEGKGSTFWFTIPYEPVDTTKPVVSDHHGHDVSDDDAAISVDEANEIIKRGSASETPDKKDDGPRPQSEFVASVDRERVVLPPGESAPKAETEQKDEDDGRQKTILVAEDIDGNFLLLKNLIPKKYKIIHAWDGNEAIDLYTINHPDLVLMDISMPIMDGYQATEAIRKINSKVPIVAVTAFAYASDRQRILKSGFNDYISKPVIREDLLDVLKRYLG